ncbi:Synaptic vesicle glycoprotein 2B [Habropoda laboriosa]|uniref:Synaptic vesicle glycoprotein 2B n=1 Tax=Habropoda laboriosa TaxID=597456 RepID=A0A0L7RCA6_9HYME|nr:Synaptic vesicle glycoprotein 2B [Habropoda laboriosa]
MFFETDEENVEERPADFEAAIAAAGSGKFQYLLLLAIIPGSWATSIDTANVAIILPSAECDLQMTFFQKGVLNAITYIGMVSSGFLWGYIADVRGRRSVFLYGYLADGICNVLSGFSQSFWTLVFFKFLSGFIISGPHASMVAYSSEFYGMKGRVRIPLIIGFSITFGNIVTTVLAWIIVPQNWSIVLWDGAFVYNPWRLFLSVCGLPMLIGVVCLSLFPESPKFLMSQGRMEDALKVFRTIYRINTGKPAEEYPIQHLGNEISEKSNEEDRDENIEKKAIFFYPYLPRILLVVVIQFGSMYASNTFRLWQPQLFTILENFVPANYNLTAEHSPTFCEILDLSSAPNATSMIADEHSICVNSVVNESVYTNTVIVAIFGSFLLLGASFVLKYINHKILLQICYGIAIICIICMNWSTNKLTTLLLTSSFIGFTNTTLNTVVAATVILFPTALRAIAVSLVMTIGRLGSICGNMLFPVLLDQGCFAPMIQLACFILLCIVLTCFLPIPKKKAKE